MKKSYGKKYEVWIETIVTYPIYVRADNMDEATDLAYEKYNKTIKPILNEEFYVGDSCVCYVDSEDGGCQYPYGCMN